jgi:hypothetical protein
MESGDEVSSLERRRNTIRKRNPRINIGSLEKKKNVNWLFTAIGMQYKLNLEFSLKVEKS